VNSLFSPLTKYYLSPPEHVEHRTSNIEHRTLKPLAVGPTFGKLFLALIVLFILSPARLQEAFEFSGDGRIGVDGGVAEECGDEEEQIFEGLHFAPVDAAALRELLQALFEFFCVFLGHSADAAVIAFHFSFGQRMAAFPTCVHFCSPSFSKFFCSPKRSENQQKPQKPTTYEGEPWTAFPAPLQGAVFYLRGSGGGSRQRGFAPG
jgi:hypothetical protein